MFRLSAIVCESIIVINILGSYEIGRHLCLFGLDDHRFFSVSLHQSYCRRYAYHRQQALQTVD